MTAAMALGGAPAFATEALTPSGYVTDVDGFGIMPDSLKGNF